MLGIQMVDGIEYVLSRKIRIILYIFLILVYLENIGVFHIDVIFLLLKEKINRNDKICSINTLSGCEQSRRDNLESIGYIIMYSIRGNLLWQGLKVNKKEVRYKKLCEKKKEASGKDLYVGFSSEFWIFCYLYKKFQFTEDQIIII